MNIFRTLLCLLLVCGFTYGAGEKAPKSTVSFHLESDGGEGPKMVFPQLVAGTERHFRFTPEITTTQVVAFRPFPSDRGDYGMVLQLNQVGKNRLASTTAANVGKWMIAQANGRVVDGVVIDQAVTDGLIVIWKGISLPEVRVLETMIPRIGEDRKAWKKRVKNLKKQIKEEAKAARKNN